jgi:hypothetical protein
MGSQQTANNRGHVKSFFIAQPGSSMTYEHSKQPATWPAQHLGAKPARYTWVWPGAALWFRLPWLPALFFSSRASSEAPSSELRSSSSLSRCQSVRRPSSNRMAAIRRMRGPASLRSVSPCALALPGEERPSRPQHHGRHPCSPSPLQPYKPEQQPALPVGTALTSAVWCCLCET